MLEINKDTVIISRKKWDELKKNDYYREIIEVLEDSEGIVVKHPTQNFNTYEDEIQYLISNDKRNKNAKR